MRIGVKLLVTYVTIIGLLVALIGLGLPRLVESAVARAEQERLDGQAQRLADSIAERIAKAVFGNRPVTDLATTKQILVSLQDMLVDDTILVVDPQCNVARASRKEFEGRRITPCETTLPARRPAQRQILTLEGVETKIASRAFIPGAALRGYSVVMVRDILYIESLARPMTRRIALAMSVVLLAALGLAGWLSSEMVRRLQATSAAAQAVAGGDLGRRAPETGNDEITDLARSFNHMADRTQTLVEGLRRSEQARKELLVTCSHELRTPMTSISGFAEALRDGVVRDDEKKQRYYAIIAAESARLTRLVNDLFDMAKLEAGQMELRLQSMAVQPWLAEFADAIRPTVEGAGVRLELVTSPDLGQAKIYGDRDRLDQVLTNLISNATRFSPPDETITLRAALDGSNVVISVADRGPGIAPGEVDRVFQRFYQGHANGQGHKGAGLGLAIVKSLVEAHGGSVGVTSSPGQGATFSIRLGKA
ncbi:MAG TPA: HAMP domain-containing sensor histidine kinase [Symbiobacteriaceae bacterium]|nr:HAMP domain-containing sensor histidine kinase [Symbiobacteriaceae bacterium]